MCIFYVFWFLKCSFNVLNDKLQIELNSVRVYSINFEKKKHSKNTYEVHMKIHILKYTGHKIINKILMRIIDCLKWILLKLIQKMGPSSCITMIIIIITRRVRKGEREILDIDLENNNFISNFLKCGMYEIWVSFPLLRTIDCGRVWKEAGYLESLWSATSIYSVRRTLMHTRARV